MRGILLAACLLAYAPPSLADPAVGVGLSLVFGGGEMQTGLGLRVFSDDDRDSFAASAGVDYLFGSNALRGTVGAAYLGDDSYLGLDIGLNLRGGGMTYGPGAGFVDTTEKAGAAAPPPPPPPPPT